MALEAAKPEDVTRQAAAAQTAKVLLNLRLQLFLGQQHGPQSPIWPPLASGTTLVLKEVQSSE